MKLNFYYYVSNEQNKTTQDQFLSTNVSINLVIEGVWYKYEIFVDATWGNKKFT
jgi:hypothetical protein